MRRIDLPRMRALILFVALLPLLEIAPGAAPPVAARTAPDRLAVMTHRQMQEAVPWAQRYHLGLRLAMSIVRQADRHGIPRAIGFRLVRAESNFDSLAVNAETRACGLTQLLPSTARQLRPEQPLSEVCRRVDLNLDAGFSYFAALHRMFQGDWRIATTAYYLGPGAANAVPAKVFDTLSYTSRILD
jgi:soluble lytic murein transglycosylase-like protein